MDFNRMIQEVQSESLQTLLAQVRCEDSPPLNIDLDAHHSSTRQETPLDSLHLGDVLEIVGQPGSGKTHLLYLLMIACIIPTTYSSVTIGGWDKVTVLFNTDASFDLARFKHLLTSRLAAIMKTPSESDAVQLLVERSLRNLHLFSPNSSTQLAETLLYLPSYHRTKLSESEIGILAIDSISAFHWSDRFTAEQLRSTAAHRVSNPFHHVVTALCRFYSTHKPMVILTNWGLTKTTESPLAFRQHLNPPPALFAVTPNSSSFTALPLTLHITLSTQPVSQIPVHFSLADACAQGSQMTSRPAQAVIRSAGGSQISHFAFTVEKDRLSLTVIVSSLEPE
ncbi:hypothetical protein BDP27DRAFT_1448733 [Rhodocollybia butyracea]|uniref:DNA recombination and repair protein Rad51-like C-terminal domain-containing protein n=1 Tax=Rhodocollybia butyracea TaxID=206335 RepID=A0A9P5PRZ2_9AGAR|nr:hypothetical protein BDP27DRAFT_1448733 [Rhodocollybia butyracea]